MKKLSIILVVALVCLTSLFATFDYSLDFISLDPLHKEYIADKNSANIAFGYIHNFSGFPDHIHQDSLIVYPLEYKGQKGMTQMQLADELHIANKARLSNYENGRREVPLEVVILMADYFQISTDYILRGIPEKEDNCLQEAVEILAAMDQKRRRAALEHLRIVEKYGM